MSKLCVVLTSVTANDYIVAEAIINRIFFIKFHKFSDINFLIALPEVFVRRCSIEKICLEILPNSQEIICAGVSPQ